MQHVGGGGEAGAHPAQDRLMQQVLGDHGLAEAVGAGDHDVGGLLEEGEGKELVQQCAIELLWPAVVEVGHGLEAAKPGVTETALEAAVLPLTLFDLEYALEPG